MQLAASVVRQVKDTSKDSQAFIRTKSTITSASRTS